MDRVTPSTQSSLPQRQEWMATLAKASLNDLEQAKEQLSDIPCYRFLRAPETGLTMVRGRAGGTGELFNLGEMTLTRCVIQLNDVRDDEGAPLTGFGYVGGRSHRHAELAALFDALLQHPDWFVTLHSTVIQSLRVKAQNKKDQQQRQTEATRVNFLTLARAETLERS
ncbi:MAG: phosphonate C-P lyase system protein PhnG [Leptolyngbyaceae bacterium]|nr:phosphonate C-P lyase system protein PhnG [Leptolyngbyaceae bacterium]